MRLLRMRWSGEPHTGFYAELSGGSPPGRKRMLLCCNQPKPTNKENTILLTKIALTITKCQNNINYLHYIYAEAQRY
ncbi:hypothetical protein J2S19_003225 [Metabacillus malikii]|uniref:Uncharacterized protein n=1 Tax=Metabacillus malikii TaxID=1504265 RepID=A0ABT9ZI26_9BACI|nr:hypothetical protein [Metabacillus malikii]